MKAREQMQTAKKRLSDVVDAETGHGSQTLTPQGPGTAAALHGGKIGQVKQPGQSLLQFLRVPAQYAVHLDISRSRELPPGVRHHLQD